MMLKSNRGQINSGNAAAPATLNEPFTLANHPEASMSVEDIQHLLDFAKMLRVGSASGHGRLVQRFVHTIPVGGVTTKTFTATVHALAVEGGYVKVSNAEGDYDIDIGIVDAVTSLCNDVITLLSGSSDGYNGYAPISTEYLTADKDVAITITTNAAGTNTKPITIEIFLFCTDARTTS